MTYVLETERLGLRQFTVNDTAFILELLNSPGWLEFIGDRNVKTEEQAKLYLENGPIKSYSEHGYGLCLVEEKDSRNAIGMCGIVNRHHLDHPDIGFAFLPAYQRKGYAFEVASATLAYAKEQLGISQISAISQGNNSRSIRLIEQIGLRFIKTFCFPGSNEELNLFSN